jgi:hypothetical protein
LSQWLGLVTAGDPHPQFLGKTIAEILREAVVEVASSTEGNAFDDERGWSGNGDDEPDQGRKSEAAEGTELKQEGIGRAEVMNDGKGKDEDKCGDRGQDDQSDIDGAMNLLPRTAVRAGDEMRLVVSTHLGGEAGYIIAPAREDLSDEWLDALTHINL